jgi:hypothetical protein
MDVSLQNVHRAARPHVVPDKSILSDFMQRYESKDKKILQVVMPTTNTVHDTGTSSSVGTKSRQFLIHSWMTGETMSRWTVQSFNH